MFYAYINLVSEIYSCNEMSFSMGFCWVTVHSNLIAKCLAIKTYTRDLHFENICAHNAYETYSHKMSDKSPEN